MVAPNPLSEQDLAAARSELAAGKPFPVWFTSAAVGVPAGRSAKVISIDDAGEGDFIQVRPAGTSDTMFCSPSELTRIRPPRKRVQKAAEVQESAEVQQPSAVRQPVEVQQPAEVRKPAERAPERIAAPASAPRTPAPSRPPAPAPASAPEKSSRSNGRPVGRSAEVTVTLNATSEGEWTVEVVIGKKRTVRPTPVQPAEVAKAARALPSAVAEAIESSLEAARRRQLERVERLRAELDAAQRALQELNS